MEMNLLTLIGTATGAMIILVGIAGQIARLTPSPRDDTFLAEFLKILHRIDMIGGMLDRTLNRSPPK